MNIIIEWCQKNGFPLEADFKEKPRTHQLLPLLPAAGFKVWDFISKLNEIYDAYLLTLIMTKQGDIWIKNKYKKKSVQECAALYEETYQRKLFTNRISFDREIHWEIKASNLFDAAFYQLALLLNYPEDIHEIGRCKIHPK